MMDLINKFQDLVKNQFSGKELKLILRMIVRFFKLKKCIPKELQVTSKRWGVLEEIMYFAHLK